ncbi:MAG: outer membrane beta-barrel protein [Alphaproteobacteria bacterium]
MRIISILYFYLLLGIFASLQAWSLTVKQIKIEDNQGSPYILFSFDEDFPPEPDQEDDETLLFEFPEDTRWEAPLSYSSPSGLSYSYIPYQDGAGDLIIKKPPNFKVGDLKKEGSFNYKLYFTNTAVQPSKSTQLTPSPSSQIQGPLTIKGIRVGQKNKNTRLVLDLSRSTKFIIKENDDFSKIHILPTEITQWIPAPSSTQSFKAFKGYSLVKLNEDIGIEVSLQKGTRIIQAALRDEKINAPKLVIDLGPSSLVPTINNEISTEKIDDLYTELKAQNNTLLSKGDSFSVIPEVSPIKEMNMMVQNNDTIIRLITSDVKNFDVQENKATQEATLFLPKILWDTVKVTEEKAGLVQKYQVDQTDPNHTKIIFKLQKGSSVVGKKSFGEKGNGRFVIYLNQKEKRTPTWLIDAAASELSYDDLEKEDGEISQLIYEGGIAPYSDVGTGFYIGVKASALSGQQKSDSAHGGYSTHLSPSNFGGGIHLLGGYGMNFDKVYTGVEANVGIYGADNKASTTLNTAEVNSSSDIKTSWGMLGRLGYYISPTSLLYGRVGVQSTSFSYGGSSGSSGEFIFPGSYSRQSRTGFLYGLGMESALSDRLSVRLEGAQINYQTFSYQNGTSHKKDRPLLNEINMGIGYKLSPMSGPAMGDVYEESVGTGFYFGADGGLSTLQNRRQVKGVNNANALTSYDGEGSTVDPAWGIFAGYSYHKDKFFMAAEGQLSLTKPFINESISQAGTPTETYTNKLQWMWALTARPGYIFNHGTIGYGRIGVVGGNFAHSAQHSNNQRTFTTGGRPKTQAWGIRVGAGLETFVNNHLALRTDYILDYLPGIKIKDANDGSIKETINIINNEFKLGLSWYIDP